MRTIEPPVTETTFDALIHALREELTHYGEVLAQLDRQQDLVVRRETDEILRSVESLNSEMEIVRGLREARNRCKGQLARTLELDEDASIEDITGRMPGERRFLLDGLARENNETLVRVQHRARQNHLLINRSMELMERLIGALFPDSGTLTYTGAGDTARARVSETPIFEATG